MTHGEPFLASIAVSALTVDKEQMPAFREHLTNGPRAFSKSGTPISNKTSKYAKSACANRHSARLSVRLSTSPAIHLANSVACLHVAEILHEILMNFVVNPLKPEVHVNNINSVRTSQETQYIAATKPSRLCLL
jgi:hypothetical protein